MALTFVACCGPCWTGSRQNKVGVSLIYTMRLHRHAVSRAAWPRSWTPIYSMPRSTILESAGSCRWPTWSSSTPCSRLSVGLLSDGARFLLQYPFSGTPWHWTFIRRTLYPFPSTAQDIFSVNLSQHNLLWHFCFQRTRCRELRNSFTIWATLNGDWSW